MPPAAGSPWWPGAELSVLVAAEDAVAREGLRRLVEPAVSAVLCVDGAEALWQAGRTRPAVVILSATLPAVSAAEVASVLARHRDGPETIAVAVSPGDADRAGPVLAAGATHVVSKPYELRELQPLLDAHLVRMAERRNDEAVLTVGALRLDGPAFEASVDGRLIRLTLREFELLHLLMRHAGKVVPAQEISRQLWESRGDSVSTNTIAVHVRRLRAHVACVAEIVAVRAVGYRLVVRGTEAVTGLPLAAPADLEARAG